MTSYDRKAPDNSHLSIKIVSESLKRFCLRKLWLQQIPRDLYSKYLPASLRSCSFSGKENKEMKIIVGYVTAMCRCGYIKLKQQNLSVSSHALEQEK